MRSTASATRAGSSAAGASGLRVSTRQNPHARVQRSPRTMNVAVPSAQHSDRFGQPASSHTVTRPRSRIVFLSASTSGPWCTLGRSHSGLRVSIDSPVVTPAAASRDASRTGSPGPLAAGEQRQVVGTVAPRDVLALVGAVAPALGGQPGDDVDDVAHRDVDPFLGKRCDRPVGDAARHDVLAHVGHVGRHVEGEAVHRAAPLEPHADGADLARVGAVRRRPTRPGTRSSRPAGDAERRPACR